MEEDMVGMEEDMVDAMEDMEDLPMVAMDTVAHHIMNHCLVVTHLALLVHSALIMVIHLGLEMVNPLGLEMVIPLGLKMKYWKCSPDAPQLKVNALQCAPA